ncbi:MAG: sulfatase-like hydrolase/transferase [Myxococcales bacterium]|nr:sulfatase-like hydrolase/transferase [Myxococcales bacterium]
MLLAMFLGCTTTPPTFAPTEGPAGAMGSNVLVVLLDDVSAHRLSGYGEHHVPARTPHLDSLGERGVRMTRAWAYPTCSAARAALLTGRHSQRNGVRYNIRPEDPPSRTLPASEVTIPELLATAPTPYVSAGIGKWHLATQQPDPRAAPLAQGFTYFTGPIYQIRKEHHSYYDYPWYADDGSMEEHASLYMTTREVDEAVAMMHRLPEPWFLYLALQAPHAPWQAPPDSLLQTSVSDKPSRAEIYNAMIEAADTEIGRLIRQADLADTVVFVLADNGTPEQAVRSHVDHEQVKNTLYEGGIRVPFLVAGAGVAGGRVIETPVSVVDVFPTVAEAAGLDPHSSSVVVDGQSLWPLLQDRPDDRRFAFVDKYFPKLGTEGQAVRDERFKLIRKARGSEELYDLQGVITEGENLLKGGRSADQLSATQREHHEALSGELDRLDQSFRSSWWSW